MYQKDNRYHEKASYGDFARQVNIMVERQRNEWELAAANYADLDRVQVKVLSFDGFEVALQHNPKRIVSSAANIDAQSIQSRPCFLCAQNRPSAQQGIPYHDEFIVLVNPFPIFQKHLTIPSTAHKAQLIRNEFGNMLSLAKALPDYVVFYNGPRCGASAPDHFHFQAGLKGLMPIENDYRHETHCRLLHVRLKTRILLWQHYLRNIITLQGSSASGMETLFLNMYALMDEAVSGEDEPMLNILAWFEAGEWSVHIIPRKLHRPRQYYVAGDDQIIVSPASVDLGGILIVPREEDIAKIDRKVVADIFSQVCLDDASFQKLLVNLKKT
jgi:hypothetical protein